MKIAFRTDASLQMGSGHVMRCLTLADALKAQGAQCHFISREHSGNLLEVIRQRGHSVTGLPAPLSQSSNSTDAIPKLAHAAWLGCDWQTDAKQTHVILSMLQPNWLVVDHYALDQHWEVAMQPYCQKIMVIDDLADRTHYCDLLLDQNLGRQPQDYVNLVPTTCQVFVGPYYALLRPEFSALRDYSLKRRVNSQQKIRKLLINMGGVDMPNATGEVLQALKTCPLPIDCHIIVVMGSTAPWLAQVRELAEKMPWPTSVLVNINDMAQRMADSDLAIGAAGSTSWERCCLGLPSILVTLADNQIKSCAELGSMNAAKVIGSFECIEKRLHSQLLSFLTDEKSLKLCSDAASTICNGAGLLFISMKLIS
jgi:UDP-2,4-diacetamido-2,4,6-trideoxy-beta-L-altropyranose hydrolase